MEPIEVIQARLTGDTSSGGGARCKLIRQFQFPHIYDAHKDDLVSVDLDRIQNRDWKGTYAKLKQHTGREGEMHFPGWVAAESTTDEQIIALFVDLLKVDPDKWTGFRLMVSVHKQKGQKINHIELFAKGERSDTEVYTGEVAPNVEQLRSNRLFGPEELGDDMAPCVWDV